MWVQPSLASTAAQCNIWPPPAIRRACRSAPEVESGHWLHSATLPGPYPYSRCGWGVERFRDSTMSPHETSGNCLEVLTGETQAATIVSWISGLGSMTEFAFQVQNSTLNTNPAATIQNRLVFWLRGFFHRNLLGSARNTANSPCSSPGTCWREP